MIKVSSANDGFTLIELMIVIAIIGILAAVAVPQYGQYSKKAQFSEVVNASAKVKTAIATCIYATNDLTQCSTWDDLGISSTEFTSMTSIQTASIDASTAALTLTGNTKLNSATYILTPVRDATNGSLSWTVGGSCLVAPTRYC